MCFANMSEKICTLCYVNGIVISSRMAKKQRMTKKPLLMLNAHMSTQEMNI